MELVHHPALRGKRANDVTPSRPRRRVPAPVLRGIAELVGARLKLADAREQLAIGRVVEQPERRAWAFQAMWRHLADAERALTAIADDAPRLARACAAEMAALDALSREAAEAAYALTQRERGAVVLDMAAARARRAAGAV